MGTTTWDMLNPEMVIIGSNNVSKTVVHDLEKFYKKILQKKESRFELVTLDEAECIKIFYNTFISAKVSLVNMIQDVAEINGNIDCDVVADALSNSTQRIISKSYMKPGMGDGGPCHPRDNIALRFLAEKLHLGYDLFDSIMTSREVQAEKLAKKLISFKLPIVILGKSYKPGVSYTEGSYSLLVGHYVNKLSNIELGFDENINDDPCTYLLAHRGCHYDFNFNVDSIVVDPWREFEQNSHVLRKIIHYGKKVLL
jgi:UDPglucose 6-dehydrogenase